MLNVWSASKPAAFLFSQKTYRSLSKFLYGDEIFAQNQKTVSNKDNYGMNVSPIFKNDVHYPELEEDDPRFSEAIKQAREPKLPFLKNFNSSDESKVFTIILEGTRLISDALVSGGNVTTLFFSSRDVLARIPTLWSISNIFYVKHRLLRRWSSLKTPPGLMAICEIPIAFPKTVDENHKYGWRPLPVTLVLDEIRDPGNMGSILRAAASFSVSSVLVTKGSVDVWNEKVVRAGMSAHFRLPIYQGLEWHEVISHFGINKDSCRAVVHVADPDPRATEQLIQSSWTRNFDNLLATNKNEDLTSDNESDKNTVELNSTECVYQLPLKSVPHFSVNYFPDDHVQYSLENCPYPRLAVILGSEAHGVSPKAFHLAHLSGGSRLVIPSAPSTESLNVLSAASVLLGEIQRQFLLLLNRMEALETDLSNRKNSLSVCNCIKQSSNLLSENLSNNCENPNCPYNYLSRNSFTSEIFKLQLKNVYPHAGFKQIKKLLNSLNVKYCKVKLLKAITYISFESAIDRDDAIRILNGYRWKGKQLEAKVAQAHADPLLLKRASEEIISESASKKLCQSQIIDNIDPSNRIDILRDTVTPLWRMPYDPDQLTEKRNSILNNLASMRNKLIKCNNELKGVFSKVNSGLDSHGRPIICPLGKVIPSPIQKAYRNKAEVTIGCDLDGSDLVVGFRYSKYRNGCTAVGSYENVDLLPLNSKIVLNSLEKFLISLRKSENSSLSSLQIYDPVTQKGNWRQALIRETQMGDTLLLLDLHPQQLTNIELDNLTDELKNWFSPSGHGAHVNITCLFLSCRARCSDMYDEQHVRHVFGKTHMIEKCCGLSFRISVKSFFQVNTQAAELLYEEISRLTTSKISTIMNSIDEINSSEISVNNENERILIDVCCGTGTIALCLAKHFTRVIGIELVLEAVEDAKLNAQINGIENVQFYAGKAEDVLHDLVRNLPEKCELSIVVDPPRAGLHESVIKTLRKCPHIQRLIYVSCNLESALHNFVDFARSTSKRFLGAPFIPVYAEGIDLFPLTKHVEVILILERILQS